MLQPESSLFTYLQSQETAQHYLKKHYEVLENVDAEAKSYEKANTLIYYLDHGKQFIAAGKQSPLLMQPILLFYGLTHLLKAHLLTRRPDYPESTSILAHGVSTRKRKRKHYTFVQDEVKVQHHGLFAYAANHLYGIEAVPFTKVKMGKLLALIPEMNHLLAFSGQQKLIAVGSANEEQLLFPNSILDDYHLTKQAFIKRITNYLPELKETVQDSDYLRVTIEHPVRQSFGPFYYHQNGIIYFPVEREHFLTIPEILIHYLLLYNLSMISRYETEWWGELLTIKSDTDFPYIKHFLSTAAEKIPFLIATELLPGLEGG